MCSPRAGHVCTRGATLRAPLVLVLRRQQRPPHWQRAVRPFGRQAGARRLAVQRSWLTGDRPAFGGRSLTCQICCCGLLRIHRAVLPAEVEQGIREAWPATGDCAFAYRASVAASANSPVESNGLQPRLPVCQMFHAAPCKLAFRESGNRGKRSLVCFIRALQRWIVF